MSLQQQQPPPQGTSGLSDLELAQQLQQEEYQQHRVAQPPARAPSPQVGLLLLALSAAPPASQHPQRAARLPLIQTFVIPTASLQGFPWGPSVCPSALGPLLSFSPHSPSQS